MIFFRNIPRQYLVFIYPLIVLYLLFLGWLLLRPEPNTIQAATKSIRLETNLFQAPYSEELAIELFESIVEQDPLSLHQWNQCRRLFASQSKSHHDAKALAVNHPRIRHETLPTTAMLVLLGKVIKNQDDWETQDIEHHSLKSKPLATVDCHLDH